MPGQGQLIQALDYNDIRNTVAGVLGSGSGSSGYGQSVSATQVGNEIIRLTHWVNLRNDMLKARQHQTGSDESGNLTLPTGTTQISEALRSEYANFATTINNNRFALAGNQSSTESIISTTRYSSWNGTISNTVTITFSNYDHARYFFNSGGQLMATASHAGGGGSKDQNWTDLLASAGTRYLDYNGYYSLSTSNSQMAHTTGSGVYAENDFYLYVRKNGDGSQVIFTFVFQDDDAGDQRPDPTWGLPGPGVDEDVGGSLSTDVSMIRASGSNVSVSGPSGSQTGL